MKKIIFKIAVLFLLFTMIGEVFAPIGSYAIEKSQMYRKEVSERELEKSNIKTNKVLRTIENQPIEIQPVKPQPIKPQPIKLQPIKPQPIKEGIENLEVNLESYIHKNYEIINNVEIGSQIEYMLYLKNTSNSVKEILVQTELPTNVIKNTIIARIGTVVNVFEEDKIQKAFHTEEIVNLSYNGAMSITLKPNEEKGIMVNEEIGGYDMPTVKNVFTVICDGERLKLEDEKIAIKGETIKSVITEPMFIRPGLKGNLTQNIFNEFGEMKFKAISRTSATEYLWHPVPGHNYAPLPKDEEVENADWQNQNNLGNNVIIDCKRMFRPTANEFCVNSGKGYWRWFTIEDLYTIYENRFYKYVNNNFQATTPQINSKYNMNNVNFDELAYILSEINTYHPNGTRLDYRLSPVQIAIWKCQGTSDSGLHGKLDRGWKDVYGNLTEGKNAYLNWVLDTGMQLYVNAKAYGKFIKNVDISPILNDTQYDIVEKNGRTLVGPFTISNTSVVNIPPVSYTNYMGQETQTNPGIYGEIKSIQFKQGDINCTELYDVNGNQISLSNLDNEEDFYFDITGESFNIEADTNIDIVMNNQIRNAFFYTLASYYNGKQNIIIGEGTKKDGNYPFTFHKELPPPPEETIPDLELKILKVDEKGNPVLAVPSANFKVTAVQAYPNGEEEQDLEVRVMQPMNRPDQYKVIIKPVNTHYIYVTIAEKTAPPGYLGLSHVIVLKYSYTDLNKWELERVIDWNETDEENVYVLEGDKIKVEDDLTTGISIITVYNKEIPPLELLLRKVDENGKLIEMPEAPDPAIFTVTAIQGKENQKEVELNPIVIPNMTNGKFNGTYSVKIETNSIAPITVTITETNPPEGYIGISKPIIIRYEYNKDLGIWENRIKNAKQKLSIYDPDDSKIQIDNNILTITNKTEVKITLSGKVWEDKYQGLKPRVKPNGVIDVNEKGISGVKVYLYNKNSTYAYVGSTTTDENGLYEFKDILQDEYFIIFEYEGIKHIATKRIIPGDENYVEGKVSMAEENILVNGENIRTRFNSKFMNIRNGKTITKCYQLLTTGGVEEADCEYSMIYNTTIPEVGGAASVLITDANGILIPSYRMFAKTDTYSESRNDINFGIKERNKGSISLNLYMPSINLLNIMLGKNYYTKSENTSGNEAVITYKVKLHNCEISKAEVDELIFYYDTNLEYKPRSTTDIDIINGEDIIVNNKVYHTLRLVNLGVKLDSLEKSEIELDFKSLRENISEQELTAYAEIMEYSIEDGIIDKNSAPGNGITEEGTVIDEDDFDVCTKTLPEILAECLFQLLFQTSLRK